MFVYLNGRMIEEKNAKLDINDTSFLRGYGIYETLRAIDGTAIRIEEHISRFFRSAKLVGLKSPLNKSEIGKTIESLLERNDLRNARIRLTLSEQNFLITTVEFISHDRKYYENGAKLVTFQAIRTMPMAKSTSCVSQVIAEKYAEKKGAIDAIILEGKEVRECAGSNIFAVKKGIIYTPKTNILLGVTRQALIENARKKGIKLIEKDFDLTFLQKADECFITSSMKWVMPVIEIDGKKVRDGRIGKITRILSVF
ncbi:MAG: aminotransferase class IV [Candidatus Micrarchaeota archaeon]